MRKFLEAKDYVIPDSDTGNVPYGFSLVDTVDINAESAEEAMEAAKEELEVEELSNDQIAMITNSTASNYKVYINEYALSLAYAYDGSISEEVWEEWNEVQQQEALLNAVVVEDDAADSVLDPDEDLETRSIDYEVTCNSRYITQDDDSFIVTKAGASVTLTFEGLADSENYLIINGLEYDDTETYDLYFGDESVDPLDLYTEVLWNLMDYDDREDILRDHIYYSPATSTTLGIKDSNGYSRTLTYYTEYYSFYSGRHDFAVCMDYSETALTSVTITFNKIGVYTYDEMLVVCEPMEAYAEQVAALSKDTLEDVFFDTDYVSGTISLEEDKWLCFSIPYSEGWSAYVDGEEVELYQANVQYMAIRLSAGDHEVELIYHTPYLRIGIVISAIGAVLCVVVWMVQRRRKRRPALQIHAEAEETAVIQTIPPKSGQSQN